MPLAAQLPPLTRGLSQAVPPLIKSFKVLAYTTNEIAYDPGGKNPGFLYWLAWFAHNADSFISNSDANGPCWRDGRAELLREPERVLVRNAALDAARKSFGC